MTGAAGNNPGLTRVAVADAFSALHCPVVQWVAHQIQELVA